MTKFKKQLFVGVNEKVRVHFQYEKGKCLFKHLVKVGFVHGLYC